jgi:hypothetical protein
MLSVMSWRCACGLHVKAMYDADGTTTFRCPDPKGKCEITHAVGGKLSHLWVETAEQVWTPKNIAPLIVSTR